MRRQHCAQLGFGRKVLEHAVLTAIGEAAQLVGVAFGIALSDGRALSQHLRGRQDVQTPMLQQELTLLVQGDISPAKFTAVMDSTLQQSAPNYFK